MNFVISHKTFRSTFKSFPYIQILNNIMSDASNPPTAPSGPEDDARIIRDGLMEELRKRQSNFERNGGAQRWDFTEVLKAGVGAFDRKYVNGIVEAYQKESDYFDIDANDKIGLTSSGKSYCNALKQLRSI